ncbi:MAG TPA: formylglycine-generating enzyme family protein, partial [Pseudomonadota bacterium]|nr:formylglycine-generating enzyme family protein [Pseudomonadota bacterium]
TDGRLLVDALGSERYRDETQALLRQLAHFPQLAFCDVSRGEFGLATHLAGLELPVLTPEQVAGFLGGVPLDPPLHLPTQISGDVRLWAAACALFPYPLDDEALFWVHDQLGLQVPGAALAQLKELGRPCGERLRFSDSPQRAALLGWLRQISPVADVPLASLRSRLQPTWLGRCLALWRQHLADEAQRRLTTDATIPWRGTPAEQHLHMQQALLDLWDQPEAAAPVLHSLGAGWLRDELVGHLSALGPLELAGHRDLCILPWHERRLPPLTQGLLRELGFGGDRPRTEVQAQRPGRLLLAWLGCAGLVLAGGLTLAQGLWQLRHPHGEPQIRQEHAPTDARVEVTPTSATEYRVTVHRQAEQATATVPAGSSVLVSWAEEERDPPDGGADPPRDLGVDQASPADLSAPADLGSPRDMTAPPDLSTPHPSCPYAEYTEPKSGMVFVKVCAGDFLMGSAKNDPDAADDEKPAYPVHLETFWIGKYEVSNAQYRKRDPSHESEYKGDDLPVQKVSWTEARAYCRSLGGDLPTEAEWEYAARGPTGRRYPWGKPEPTAERAVFGQTYPGTGPESATAKPKGRSPFGTLNQAGNVWEWVTDCYQSDRYAKRKAQSDKTDLPSPLVNPVDDRPGCDRRVSRGGAFNNGPWALRAAVRDGVQPENRLGSLGFRCVRGSVRQP